MGKHKKEIFNRTKIQKYVKQDGFLSFAGTFGDKYGKKLINAAIKTEIDAAKTASKRVVQKTEDTTVDLVVNKRADKITLLSKIKNKENKNERLEIYIPPEKVQ